MALITAPELTPEEEAALMIPSYHGQDCPGSGDNGRPCWCDECPHYLTCFPDWHLGAIWDEDTQRFI